MKKTSICTIVLATTLLTGCATKTITDTTAAAAYNPATDARLRASYLKFFPGKACYSPFKWGGTAAGGTGWIWAKNKSIGMPVAPGTPKKYNEYVVKAGKPISFVGYQPPPPSQPGQISFSFGPSCSTVRGTLIPEAGKDYEVFFDADKCQIVARELFDEDGLVSVLRISLMKTPRC